MPEADPLPENLNASLERAREVFQVEIESLEAVRDSIGPSFLDAVRQILDCTANRGKVVVTGMGKSLHVGQKIAATFTSTGTPSVTLHPAEAMHGDLGLIQPGDLVLAISYSGESEELNLLLPVARRSDIRILALTGSEDSSLARMSDLVLPVTVPREACPFNMAPTASTTATLAMGDALALALLDARGFKKEDYARLHPGGAIGRSLLIRIRDVMRPRDRIAAVAPDATVKDGLFAMTRSRSGAVIIIDPDEKILGIFTDGDLRRKIQESLDLSNNRMADVMSPHPKRLHQDALALEALSLFEQNQIDDVPVVDDQERLVGLVDITDLPAFKIM